MSRPGSAFHRLTPALGAALLLLLASTAGAAVSGLPQTVFDARGFESAEHYPEGVLRAFEHGGWGWQPHSTAPSLIVDTGVPRGKVLRRPQLGAGTHRDWLYFPPVQAGILILEADIRVSTSAGRTLDLAVTELGTGRQHAFLGWGTNPGGDQLCFYDGSAWVPLLALNTEWRHYRWVHYLSGPHANTFDLFVDGLVAGAKLPFRTDFNPAVHSMESLRINAAAGPAGEFAEIDNLRITAQPLLGPEELPVAPGSGLSREAAGFSFTFDTHLGYGYSVDFTENPMSGDWESIAYFAGTGGPRGFGEAFAGDRGFYRVRTTGLDAGGGDPGDGPGDDGALFDGFLDYVEVELEDATFTDVEGLTVAVWVKLNANSGVQTFANRGARGELFTLYLFNDHVRMLVEYGPDGQYRHASTLPPPLDTWVHYAGTYDGQTIRLFVNGVEVDSTAAAGSIPVRDNRLYIGATAPLMNSVDGRLADFRMVNTALSAEQIGVIMAGGEPVAEGEEMRFSSRDLEAMMRSDWPEDHDGEPEYPFANGTLATTDGFRGIWYVNGRRDDGLHKYSGGLGTYPQQHAPIAIYAEEVNKTFFTYGGRRKDRNRLLHMVSVYDHETGLVARPRILLDKHTSDAHDNPTISIDRDGHIWIFSNAHGTGRPSYIHRSIEPWSVEAFAIQVTTNFSYSQPWFLEEHDFVFPHTIYGGGRRLHVMNSADGMEWTEPRLLARIKNGHYQISWPRGNTIGTAFNYHPDSTSPLPGTGLNWRTNLYYMESDDGGHTWRNVEGQILDLPLAEVHNPALAVDHETQLNVVYLKSMQYTAEGHPVILYLTTPGWQSGPENDPRVFTISRWTGTEWKTMPVTSADNNYDYAALYIEDDGVWRIIGSTEPGPQVYNTGGEMAMWVSQDEGETWEMVRLMTQNSEYNHTYPRKPLNAHPDFYAFWADGHGREQSSSRFYFCNRQGDVFRLPHEITGDDLWVAPIPVP